MEAMKGGGDEYLMGRQYEHLFVGHSDHHGIVSQHTGKYIDTVAEEGIRLRISDVRSQIVQIEKS